MRSPLCTIIVLPERYLARGGALLYVYLPLCYLRHLPSTCALYFWALLWRFQCAMELDLLPSVPRVWWPSMLALRRIHLHALCSQEGLGVA